MNWKLSPKNRKTLLAIVFLTTLMVGGAFLSLSRMRVVTRSAIYPAVTVPELARKTDVILMGKVTKKLPSRVGKDSTGEKIVYTEWLVEVKRYLKNPLEQESIKVRTIGGSTPLLNMVAHDQPKFTVDEDVLLFLRKRVEEHEYFVVDYGVQGKYSVKDNLVIPGYPGAKPSKTLNSLLEEITTAIPSGE